MRRLVPLLLVLGALAAPAHASAAPARAVVALADTGIDPYHQVFRDRSARAYQYPGTYLPGYPRNATALKLHLDVKDYWAAVRADCKVWKSVVPGKLYWVPGTRIVGAISFSPPTGADIDCDDPPEKPAGFLVLDEGGHGTMTASRAASSSYGACRTCLVVSAQFPTSVSLLSPADSTHQVVSAVKWMAANAGWIDAQSNSWGPVAPVYDPTGQAGLLAANKELDNAVEEVSKKHLAFWASGNGAAFRYGVVGHPTLLAPHLGPSAIIVGGDDSGYVATWPGFSPHVVSDGCNSWAANYQTTNSSADTVGSGTSAATPYVAGGAVQILMEARRILGDTRTGVRGDVVASGRKTKSGPLADGKLTLAEWRDVVFKTADPRPKATHDDGPTCGTGEYGPIPVKWSDVPASFPEYTLIGYGGVDVGSVALAGRVLRGDAPLPDRAATDQWFAYDRQVREATGLVFRG
jgi:hypothetical protein